MAGSCGMAAMASSTPLKAAAKLLNSGEAYGASILTSQRPVLPHLPLIDSLRNQSLVSLALGII